MSYLSVTNFWKYQNADVWKKSKTHPPWFKFYVHRDREIDKLPPLARLLWYEILAAATRNTNVLEANLNESERDLKWICSEVRMEPEVVAEMLPLLLKGGWLSQTQTPRRSRNLSRKNLEGSRDLRRVEVEEEKALTKTQNRARANGTQAVQRIERLIQNGVLYEPFDLEAELAAEPTLNDSQRAFLRALIPAGDRIPPELLHDTEPETE